MYQSVSFEEVCLLITLFFGIGLVTGWVYGLLDGKDTIDIKKRFSSLVEKNS